MTDKKVFCYYNYYLDLKRKILKVEVKMLKNEELLYNKSIGLLFRSYKEISKYIFKALLELIGEFRATNQEEDHSKIEIKVRKEDNEKFFKEIFIESYEEEYDFEVEEYDKSYYDGLGKVTSYEEIKEPEEINLDAETGIITLDSDNNQNVEEKCEDIEKDKVKILLKDDYESIVFLDVITNEIGSDSKEVVCLGASKVDIKGETLDAFYSYVKPRINSILTDELVNEYGISQEMIDSAETFDNIIQDFMYWVGNKKTLFMTWGESVIDIILKECERSDIDCEIAYDIDNNYFDLQFEFVKCYFKNEESISLEEALKLYGLEVIKETNLVLDNAMNMLQLYRACEN